MDLDQVYLHAIWHEGALHLWGEGPLSRDAPGGRDRAHDVPIAHPFALEAADLRALLGEFLADALLGSVAVDGTLTLRLPADADERPLHSRQCDPGAQPALLGAFVIPTLAFGPTDAIDLLLPFDVSPSADATLFDQRPAGVASGSAPAAGGRARPGDSVGYWAYLARLVSEYLAHQQFYPAIEQRPDGTYAAAWRLLICHGQPIADLEHVAQAMPPVCLAADVADGATGINGANGVNGATGVALAKVEAFLMATADALVRRDIALDPFFARVHDKASDPQAPPEIRWLSALLGHDPILQGSAHENWKLAEQAQGWAARIEDGRGAERWRLCITLHEPPEPPEHPDGRPEIVGPPASWHVTFQLQSEHDERQLIDAADLFAEAPGASLLLGRNLADRRATLLAELARAAVICPPLERLLDEPAPIDLPLGTSAAFQFIRQWAPALLAHDVRVFLPAWVGRSDRPLGLLLSVHPTQGSDAALPDVLDAGADADAGALSLPRRQSAMMPRPIDAAGQSLGLQALLEFEWQVALGDARLSPDEFRRLVEQQEPLVRYRGQWIAIDAESARAALGVLERNARGRMTLGEALRTAYGAGTMDTGLPVLGLAGTDWVGRFLEQTSSLRIEDLPQPRTFCGSLRPYQRRGLQWLWFLDRLGIGGCLADDMGLGKTIQLIALLLHEREGEGDPQTEHRHSAVSPNAQFGPLNSTIGPTLLFAPTSVVGNWQREAQRFAPSLRVMVHHGPDRLSGPAFAAAAAKHDLVITSYALAHRDISDLSRQLWYRIALDEAQKVKNPAAASTLAIRSLSAARKVALTGTPIENHLSELWSIMELLDPGLLGAAGDFRERFAIPIEKLGDAQRSQQLRQLIRPFVLRRTKSDPLIASDLPEKMEMKVFCNLTVEQAAIYERITADMLNRIDSASGIRRRGLVLAALTRLKQVCDHPALLERNGSEPPRSRTARRAEPAGADPAGLHGRSGKVERLIEMLEEVLEEGDAALIFTQYREMGHLLERLLADRLGVPLMFLHGGTPTRQRQAMIDRFQRPGSDVKLFVLSLRAGGLGLNLTAANHVFHFDRWWNPAVEAQATDRAHRIGQTRNVQVHKFVCAGTVEERIDKLLSDKLLLADRIVAAGDEWLTNLSTHELRQYLSLSRDEAIGEF